MFARGTTLVVCLAAVLAAIVAPSARAEVIPIDPSRVKASTEIPGFDRIDDHLVDYSGLSGLQHSSNPNGTMWLSRGIGYGGVDSDPYVEFDLGTPATINSIRVWNYNESGGSPAFVTRGVKEVSISYGLASSTETTLPGIGEFSIAPASSSYTGEVFDSFAPFKARYIKFDINGNHGSPEGFYGLSEVQFEGTTSRVRPLGAQASSELTGAHNRRVGNAVDGVGQTTTAANGWPSDPQGMWLSANGDTRPTIAFDLGGLHTIDTMMVYNYNEPGGWLNRGVQQANLSYSTDNVTYTPAGTVSFSKATGNSSNPGQFKSLGGVQARYVKLEVLSNYSDGSYTGLNEVEFFGTPQERMPLRVAGVTATSELHAGGFDRRDTHLIDATGLFAGTHSTVPDSTMWLSDGVGFGGDPGNDGDPEIVFDLGGLYVVPELQIWNYNEIAGFLNRGVDELEILGSTDGTSFVSLGTFNLAIAPGAGNVDFSQTLSLPGVNLQYLKFDILSNHNGVTYPTAGGVDNAFVGLSEVRFFGTMVPEPSTLAIWSLLAGVGLGAARRRRKR